MRIRFIKSVSFTQGKFSSGSVAEISDDMAMEYMRAGLAIQDKSLDGAKETKPAMSEEKYRCSSCCAMHRIDSKTGQRHLKYREA